jgi:chromate transport protein ChrA
MNTGLLFSGIAASILGVLLEVLIRKSKSETWRRTRILVILGVLLIVASIF